MKFYIEYKGLRLGPKFDEIEIIRFEIEDGVLRWYLDKEHYRSTFVKFIKRIIVK